MGEMREMTVRVDESTAALIEAFLAEGLKDESEVVRYAVAMFAYQREDDEWEWQEYLNADGPEPEKREKRLQAVRAMIEEGIASGPAVEADDAFWEGIKRRGREQLEASRRQAAE